MAHKPLVHFVGGSSAGNILNVESGGKIVRKSGGSIASSTGGGGIQQADIAKNVVSPAKVQWTTEGSAQGGILLSHDVNVPHSTTVSGTTITLTMNDRVRIIDVTAHKREGGASATTVLTMQVKSSTGGAISDAMNLKVVQGNLVRATNLATALSLVSSGGSVKIVRAGSAGTAVAGHNTGAVIRIHAIKRTAST